MGKGEPVKDEVRAQTILGRRLQKKAGENRKSGRDTRTHKTADREYRPHLSPDAEQTLDTAYYSGRDLKHYRSLKHYFISSKNAHDGEGGDPIVGLEPEIKNGQRPAGSKKEFRKVSAPGSGNILAHGVGH